MTDRAGAILITREGITATMISMPYHKGDIYDLISRSDRAADSTAAPHHTGALRHGGAGESVHNVTQARGADCMTPDSSSK